MGKFKDLEIDAESDIMTHLYELSKGLQSPGDVEYLDVTLKTDKEIITRTVEYRGQTYEITVKHVDSTIKKH